VLDAGPAAWGWEDQCWTLARIGELVRERFGVEYTLAGMDVLLHRIGWSVQVPARRAAERSLTVGVTEGCEVPGRWGEEAFEERGPGHGADGHGQRG
jgi:hypothetical protein